MRENLLQKVEIGGTIWMWHVENDTGHYKDTPGIYK